MNEQLSESLHAKLDSMGAPPRAAQPTPTQETAEPENPVTEPLAEPEAVLQDQAETLDAETTGEQPAEVSEAAPEPKGQEKYKPAELAAAIGWEPSEIYNDLMVPIGDGETLSLGEMKDRFDKLAGQQAEIQKARELIQQQALQAKKPAVSPEIQEAEEQKREIVARYQVIDWEDIERENPGQAANLRQKFMAAMHQAEQKLGQAQAKAAHEQKQSFAQLVQRENERVTTLIPEWKDKETYAKEAPEIHKYLTEVGFTGPELGGIFDARARRIAREAWLWRKHQGEVQTHASKARKAPKVLRPGTGVSRTQIQDQQTQRLEQTARSTGRVQDKLAAARAIVGNLKR